MDYQLQHHWLLGLFNEFRKDRLGTLLRMPAYGPVYRFRLLGGVNYLVSDPELVEQVLLDKRNDFIKNTGFWRRFTDVFGEGLLTAEGEQWKSHRKLVAPAFQAKAIEHYLQYFEKAADNVEQRLQHGEVIDVFTEMMTFTLETVNLALFDRDFQENKAQLIESVVAFEDQFAARILRPWGFLDKLPNARNRAFWAAKRTLNQIILSLITDARQRAPRGNALDRLVHSSDYSAIKLNDRQLQDELITLILAGHDTTSITLSWTFYLLSQHPQYWTKLREEWQTGFRGVPTIETFQELPLTRGVIKEALRLYPSAYIIGREALRNVDLGGTLIPKEKAVVISPYVMGRDERFYSNADQFIPERWTPAFEQQLPRFAFIPFGGGKRTCIGEQFAMIEAMYLLWRIGRNWHFEYTGATPARPDPILTLIPKGGMPMRAVSNR